jgi:Cys-tRNA(Pro)/Cys-tRNA(Cys) deacylase
VEVVDGEEVRDLECRPRHLGESQPHIDQFVELERLPVTDIRLEHRRFEARFSPLGEGVADMAKVRHPCFFEVRQIVAVMHDAHRVGLDEAHPDPMDELVVAGFGGRIDRETHARTLPIRPDPARPGRLDWLDRSYWLSMTPAIRLLESAGIDFTIHEYDRGDALSDFGREAAEALGLPFDQVFKTLVVDADDALAVAVLPVSCQLSMKFVAAALGVKRATMADARAAERSSGYVVGGISPLGQRRVLPTVVDESAELFDRIYVSGGRRGMDIALAPADLAAVLGATVAAITA